MNLLRKIREPKTVLPTHVLPVAQEVQLLPSQPGNGPGSQPVAGIFQSHFMFPVTPLSYNAIDLDSMSNPKRLLVLLMPWLDDLSFTSCPVAMLLPIGELKNLSVPIGGTLDDSTSTIKFTATFDCPAGHYTIRWRIKVHQNSAIPDGLHLIANVTYVSEVG
ncbi:hypothetical protein EDD21DRAFT_418454 [Dissophora ornata]|nr:hypothetical protein EDD21DRAFT_418454 [Dissophora ornata]